MQAVIRSGTKADLPQVFELIKELALFERAPQEVTNSVARMEAEGFGPNPAFGFFVAEEGKRIVGISVYYFRYSTWKGRRLFLEDLVVTESHRNKGIGKLLFERTLKKTMEEGCSGMAWQVLDWNEPAIKFYERYGARFDDEWVNCSLDERQIEIFLGGK